MWKYPLDEGPREPGIRHKADDECWAVEVVNNITQTGRKVREEGGHPRYRLEVLSTDTNIALFLDVSAVGHCHFGHAH